MALGIGGQIALQGGLDIGQSVIGNIFQKRNIRLQRDANLHLADYAYGKDQEMWHMQNLYNSPKSQMQRFAQAGLNPNLIYGRGTPGNAMTAPKRQAVTQGLHTTKMPKMDYVSQFQNLRQQQAQINNIEADTQYKSNLADTQRSVATMKMIDAHLQQVDQHYWAMDDPTFRREPGVKYRLSYGRDGTTSEYQRRRTFLGNRQKYELSKYNLNVKKDQLLNAQIDLTLQNLYTKQRQYRWMPWEKGFNMGTRAVGTGIGAMGVSKLGKSGKLIGGTKPPKLRKPNLSRMRRSNRDIGPNYNF